MNIDQYMIVTEAQLKPNINFKEIINWLVTNRNMSTDSTAGNKLLLWLSMNKNNDPWIGIDATGNILLLTSNIAKGLVAIFQLAKIDSNLSFKQFKYVTKDLHFKNFTPKDQEKFLTYLKNTIQ